MLDGPVSSGKSIALAMLVQWAREEGWLVLYVPSGKEWTHGGFFYKHPLTGLWDTPVQAENVLKARMLISLLFSFTRRLLSLVLNVAKTEKNVTI